MSIVAEARPLADDIGRRLQITEPESKGPACMEEDPELFFPKGNNEPYWEQIEEAKAVCRRCPVVEACLEAALARGEEHGVWGGLSEVERRAVKRAQLGELQDAEVAA